MIEKKPGTPSTEIATTASDGSVLTWEYSSLRLDLSPIERKVLDIAKTLIEKHQALILQDLYREAARALKQESKMSIIRAVDNLVQKKVLIERKAITRETILNNATRKAIFEWIVYEPGIHFSRLRDLLQRDSKSIAAHVGMLKQFGLVRSVDFENNTIYFETSFDVSFDILYYYLHKKHVVPMLEMILAHPNISFQDLCDSIKLDITENALLRKLNIIADKGFLTTMRDGTRIIALRVHPRFESRIKDFVARVKNENLNTSK